jgi:competence protein ComEA
MNHRRPLRPLVGALLAALLLGGAGTLAHAAQSELGSQGVVNVNTATAQQLELLPGIGPAKARAILEARRSRGGFENVDELAEVKGIGEVALERLRPYATVKGKTTAEHP